MGERKTLHTLIAEKRGIIKCIDGGAFDSEILHGADVIMVWNPVQLIRRRVGHVDA